MVARMRFVHEAVEELKKEDPGTCISEHYIRNLVKRGVIPSVSVGKRHRLINYDKLLEYLENPMEPEEDEGEDAVGGIRRIR